MSFNSFVAEMARRVWESTQSVTLITDLQLMDHSSLDQYFQVVYWPNTSLAEWRALLKQKSIKFKCDFVWVMIGNTDIPWNEQLSVESQFKKLIQCIVKYAGRKIKRLYIGAILPRADKEVKYADNIRMVNAGINKAVRDLKRSNNTYRGTMSLCFVPVQKLFLERYTYFDLMCGQTTNMTRIIRPLDRYFVPGRSQLNACGLYHIRSYVLKIIGILPSESNAWDGIPRRREPIGVTNQKREAFLSAQKGEFVEADDADTDVEDDFPPPVVIDIPQRSRDRRVVVDTSSSVEADQVLEQRICEHCSPDERCVQPGSEELFE